MDYPCGKFGDFSSSCFGSIVRTDTHRQTDVDEHFTNNNKNNNKTTISNAP